MSRGYFITFEGLDGAGKSTQVAALGAALRAAGHDVVTVRPSDTELGEMARGFLLQHMDAPLEPWSEALLFVAARVQLLQEVINPALERGAVVLGDRFADSTLAYQGGARGLGIERLRELHRQACGDLWPDLTLLFDLPLDAAVLRQRAQQLPLDRIESSSTDFHRAVQRTFEQLAAEEPHRFVRIDATRSVVEVAQQIWEVVNSRLSSRQSPARQVVAAG
jgi:dTMP kinase